MTCCVGRAVVSAADVEVLIFDEVAQDFTECVAVTKVVGPASADRFTGCRAENVPPGIYEIRATGRYIRNAVGKCEVGGGPLAICIANWLPVGEDYGPLQVTLSFLDVDSSQPGVFVQARCLFSHWTISLSMPTSRRVTLHSPCRDLSLALFSRQRILGTGTINVNPKSVTDLRLRLDRKAPRIVLHEPVEK